jgi:hypothetical protein
MRAILAVIMILVAMPVYAQSRTVETIVCVRHGEKPAGGLGQLTCQGLNRSLALPDVLLKKFGKPQYIFAPNPSGKSDHDKYYYIRPLATIEPTAIRCGLPVDTEYKAADIDSLQAELDKPKYKNAVVFVAWEHTLVDELAQHVLKANGGDATKVPEWKSGEFDMIFVLKITHENGHRSASLRVGHEGLNGMKTACP